MRISDWSSDVCSSDLQARADRRLSAPHAGPRPRLDPRGADRGARFSGGEGGEGAGLAGDAGGCGALPPVAPFRRRYGRDGRSEEHTSELQSLMRISYAVFCLKKKKQNIMTSMWNKK